MSLVDYASSDNEDQEQDQRYRDAAATQPDQLHPHQPPTSTSSSTSQYHQRQQQASSSLQSQSSGDRPSQVVSSLLPPPFEKLPDASMLLSSPILSQPVGTDHSARVAAAMAENASRKRESNGSSSSLIRGKIPRSNLPHSKNIPETNSGLLTPPQLRGRSNVVTEDISKLFVKRKSAEKS